MSDDAAHETALFSAFIVAARRDRYASLLAKKSGRKKLRACLAHMRDFDERWIVPIPAGTETSAGIERVLRNMGAPPTCHVVSEKSQIDGREMPLADAISEVLGWSMGTLISCVAGELAFYEGESRKRFLLHRPRKP